MVNPYTSSQPALTWDALIASANYAFRNQIGQSGVGWGPIDDEYFNSWMLAMVQWVWPSFVVAGPTRYDYGQVVLSNPVTGTFTNSANVVVTVNQVYNYNWKQISLLDTRALNFYPGNYVPQGVIPI